MKYGYNNIVMTFFLYRFPVEYLSEEKNPYVN